MSKVTLALPTPERVRRLVGLARPQMLRALKTTDARVLDIPDAEQDPAVLTKAAAIEAAYALYTGAIIAAIKTEAKNPAAKIDGKPYLSTRQAARALGVGEFHLANMRDRGKLPAQRAGRNYAFAVKDLITIATKPEKAGGYHSPLAGAFLEYLDESA